MNRQLKDRRISKRVGAWDRRGGKRTRQGPNPSRARRVAKARRLWKENAQK